MTDGPLLQGSPAIEWQKAKTQRDILSHHYFDLNADPIFNTCETKMALLEETLKNIISDLKQNDATEWIKTDCFKKL